jgi:hypothetical protein
MPPREGDPQRIESKIDLMKKMEQLGFVLGNPERIIPLFRRNKFRRLVVNMGVGQLHNWFLHKFVIDEGSGVPRFRNLHVHNGSDQEVRSVTVTKEPDDGTAPVMAPPQGDVVLREEWAVNDVFPPEIHATDLTAIKVHLKKCNFLGLPTQAYEAVIDPEQDPAHKIETVWLNIVNGEDGGFRLESVLWMGPNDDHVHPVTPPIVDMVPV